MLSVLQDDAQGLVSAYGAARLIGVRPESIYQLPSVPATRSVKRFRKADVLAYAARREAKRKAKQDKKLARLREREAKLARPPVGPAPTPLVAISHHAGKRGRELVSLGEGWSLVGG